MRALLKFLLLDAGLLKDPLLIYAVLSSFGRAGLIFSINETARTLTTELMPVLMLAASAAATIVFAHLTRIRNHTIVKSLQRDMRLALSRGVLSADVSFLLKRDKGSVYTALTNEITVVSQVAINLIQALQAILLLVFCIPYLFYVSWFTGFTTIAAVGIGVVGYIIADIPARALVSQANTQTARFFNRVTDMLSGWTELRLHNKRRVELEADIVETVDEIRKQDVQAERYFSVSQGFSEAALILLISANVVFLPLIHGDAAAMFQVLTVVLLTYGPIEQIFAALPQLSRAISSQQRISRVVAALTPDREEAPVSARKTVTPAFNSIEFRDVCVDIEDDAAPAQGKKDSFRFGPINLTLRAGEVVFITGGNGAGKTTFLTLLCGLRYPDSGQILLDGVPVTPDNITDYRALFSTVLNQFHLFDKAYGFEATNLTALEDNIKRLRINDRVGLEDRAFSSLALSTGQRRRLALAVALSEQNAIMVLDEFTADQDPASRAYFYAELIPHMARHHEMLIAVTHDEVNFSKCSHLVKMDAGRITEDRQIAQPDWQKPSLAPDKSV
jgi:putative ATP-binding cassette transporter